METHHHAHGTTIPFGPRLRAASSLGLGFLVALSATNIFHFTADEGFSVHAGAIALAALLASGLVGYFLARHLSVCTDADRGDPADAAFVALVVISGLVHTTFDGLVVHEAFREAGGGGFVVLLSILFHEIVRTTIFFSVVRLFGFGRAISTAIVFGVSAAGIAVGYLASGLLAGLHDHEALVELVSGAIFFAVAVDLWFFIRHAHKKANPWWLAGGVILSAAISAFLGHE